MFKPPPIFISMNDSKLVCFISYLGLWLYFPNKAFLFTWTGKIFFYLGKSWNKWQGTIASCATIKSQQNHKDTISSPINIYYSLFTLLLLHMYNSICLASLWTNTGRLGGPLEYAQTPYQHSDSQREDFTVATEGCHDMYHARKINMESRLWGRI